jgi:hypothetical protein
LEAVAIIAVTLVLIFIVVTILFSSGGEESSSFGNVPVKRVLEERTVDLSKATHLVLVPCHGVYIRNNYEHGHLEDDQSWALESFQLGQKIGNTFMDHMKTATSKCSDLGEDCVLIFSGSQTKLSAGPISEGWSYWKVAFEHDWFGFGDVVQRAFTEEFARDSFENLLFSICRFKEITGNYPSRITVVGYEFKKERFMQLHRAALRFPESSFSYIGRQETPYDPFPPNLLERMSEGEHNNAYKHFVNDLYGCHSETLVKKRQTRNPFSRQDPYKSSCPDIKNLLAYCGISVFSETLPWD